MQSTIRPSAVFNFFIKTGFIICLMTNPGVDIKVSAQNMEDHELINEGLIDDRSSADLSTAIGSGWRLVTDQVMGGISRGSLTVDNYRGRSCLRLQADVSTENNGGFVQMVLDLTENRRFDASAYSGVELVIAGNNELYNIHFRSADLWLPWQSYRGSFEATEDWVTIRINFDDLSRYKTTSAFRKDRLKRIGLLAIGRNFKADLCLASMRFYKGE